MTTQISPSDDPLTAKAQARLAVARHNASRRCLLLLKAVIETPGLVDRLSDVLGASEGSRPAPSAPVRMQPTAAPTRGRERRAKRKEVEE